MATAKPTTKVEQIKTFAEAFFTHFGAHIRQKRDEWVVTLPPELIEVFGKPKLYLVFPTGSDGEPRDLSPTEDLLVYGSRTFDQMLGLLTNRGEAAQLHFEAVVKPAADESPLPLHNCQMLKNSIRVADERFFLFNFRAAYVSDEKQEQFITIALNEAGRPRPDIADFVARFDAQSQNSDIVQTANVQTMRGKHALAESEAKKFVEQKTVVLQRDIKQRLQKVLLRLNTYYQRLLDEIDSDDPAQAKTLRHDLQQDLSRKIADELDRHRLRVTLSPVSYALAVAPVAYHLLDLATRHTRQRVSLTQNLHSGQVNPVDCFHCRQPIDTLALCDHAHPVHPHCLDTCCRCGKDVCHQHKIQRCALCNQFVCFECVADCAYDDHWICAEHIQVCAICGNAFCSNHAVKCGICAQSCCHTCVDAKTECATCRTALRGKPGGHVYPPAVPGQKTARLTWRYAKNSAWTVYIGQPKSVLSVLGRMVIVVDNAETVIFWAKSGLLKWLP